MGRKRVSALILVRSVVDALWEPARFTADYKEHSGTLTQWHIDTVAH